jgi:ketosteroid isomerase-like protein
MSRVHITLTAVTVLLLGCQLQGSTFTDAEKSAVEAEIEATRDAYFDAATTLDADAMVAFWDEDFIHVSNAYVVPLTLEALREGWRPLSHIEMDVTSDRVVALSRNSGYTLSTASYVVFDTAGLAVDRSDWAGTHIWIRTDEGWKVQAVHEGRPIQMGEALLPDTLSAPIPDSTL